MLTNEQIKELGNVLDFFNSDENFDVGSYSSLIESPKEFFKLIGLFDQKKIKKILSEKKSRKLKVSKKIDFNPSESELLEILNKNTAKELEEKYSLAQLKIMYEKLYSEKPLSKTNKSKLANYLKQLLLQQQRGADFLDV